MDAFIATACCALSFALGHLWATTRHRSAIERLTVQRNTARIAADNAERDLEFERLTNPDRIQWDTAGVDRLIAEIRSQELLDQLHRFDALRAEWIIDLRDNKGGAS